MLRPAAMALRGGLLLLLGAVLACAEAQQAAARGTGAVTREVDSTLAAVLGAASAAVVPPVPECSLAAGSSGPLMPGARYSVDIVSGGKARTFLVRLPDALAQSMPVLFAVHGAMQSATIFLDVEGECGAERRLLQMY